MTFKYVIWLYFFFTPLKKTPEPIISIYRCKRHNYDLTL